MIIKSIFYRLLIYTIGLILIVFLFNIDLSAQPEGLEEIIRDSPFFDEWKVYYSLSTVIILGGLIEKKQSKKLDENLILKVFICVISIIFYFIGYKFQPLSNDSVSYNWMDYFKMIFFGSIWIGLYIQMLGKEKKRN
jgi:hypothetical protein